PPRHIGEAHQHAAVRVGHAVGVVILDAKAHRIGAVLRTPVERPDLAHKAATPIERDITFRNLKLCRRGDIIGHARIHSARTAAMQAPNMTKGAAQEGEAAPFATETRPGSTGKPYSKTRSSSALSKSSTNASDTAGARFAAPAGRGMPLIISLRTSK